MDDVLAEVESICGGRCSLVEVTGGEPLLQPAVHELMRRLCDRGKTVLVETDGVADISPCDPRVIRIMDIKTPGSGEAARNRWENIEHLTPRDEVKFVLCDRADYDWSRGIIDRFDLPRRVHAVLMSAAAPMAATGEIAGTPGLPLRNLAEWVLADKLPVRVQTQLHKLIWDPAARGV
jgi:7-carboxy-7-deazaguanine synthase